MKPTFLDVICDYFDHNRQVGHTRAVIQGAERTGAIILAANPNHAAYLKTTINDPKQPVIALSTPDRLREALRGHNKPLVIDNFTWSELRKNVVETIVKAATKANV